MLCLVSLEHAAQTDKQFTDPAGKFTIRLVGDWRVVSYNDAVGRPKTEFVYRDRSEGLLRITKEGLGGKRLADFVRDEEESSRVYRSGFELITKEAFGGGALNGMLLSFYYAEGNRRLAAGYYYLQEGDSAWVLRFTGRRGSLDTIRNLTDQLARSFRTR
jgi:hypothetical protein